MQYDTKRRRNSITEYTAHAARSTRRGAPTFAATGDVPLFTSSQILLKDPSLGAASVFRAELHEFDTYNVPVICVHMYTHGAEVRFRLNSRFIDSVDN